MSASHVAADARNHADAGQEVELMVTHQNRERSDLFDFAHGMVVSAKQPGLNNSKAGDLLRLSSATVCRV